MKKILFILILTLSYQANSQGQANNWYFGKSAGINFANGAPTNISNSSIAMNTEEGCSTFSDYAGNILFYSDGNTVWNKNHDPMPNGENLLGNSSSTQSAMIIPKPGSATEYYIFTVGTAFNGTVPGFNYYSIDITADSGLGDVVAGPVDLSKGKGGNWSEKIAAVKGVDCDTYWVISLVENTFYAYEVNLSGVSDTPVLSIVSETIDRRGSLKISPNGKKIAFAIYTLPNNSPFGDSSVFLYDFDDATGVISNEIRLFNDPSNTNHPYGLEFSRQSTKLYTSTYDSNRNHVYQYDLESNNIAQSQTLIHSQIGFRGALQLAPDGKIYATVPLNYWTGTKFLDVINNPEADGVLCNYEEDVINLGSGVATQGLPPFFSSIFSPIEITGIDDDGNSTILNNQVYNICSGDNLNTSTEALPSNSISTWYKDGAFYSNSLNLTFTNVSPSNNGLYSLVVELYDNCGNILTQEGEFTLEVFEIPIASTPANPMIECDDDNNGTYLFDLSQYDVEIINNQPNTEVLYYLSQEDADNNNSNSISSPFESGSTTIYARIHNIDKHDCFDTTTFDIQLYDAAFPITPNAPLALCDNFSVGNDTDGLILFDLTEKETEILGNQSTGFTLTYFTNASYNPSNQILSPESFENTISGGQTIYVRMTNNLESFCFDDTSFEIQVFELPTIQSLTDLINCDSDGTPDGFLNFNLNQAISTITTNEINLTTTFHLSMADADSNLNPVNSSNFNNTNAIDNKIYARVENSNGCYRASTVDLKVSVTTFPLSYLGEELVHCDDDDTIDGLNEFDLSQMLLNIITQFPSEQNLRVQFYRNSSDAQLEQNEIIPQDTYMSETPFSQTIFVRVENEDNDECFGIGPYLTLIVNPRPEFEVDPNAIICIDQSASITLETYNPNGVYTYQWTDESGAIVGNEPSLTITSGGIYTVIATSSDNCESFPHLVTVDESNIATITSNDVTVVDDSINNTVTINNDNNNLGIGDYEFALDDEFGFYQDMPLFEMVLPGIHTIFVRDKNGCGIVSLEISVVGFPKFFTPNNDGHNDNWKVLGINENFYPTSLIYIYDRFGKIISKIDPTGEGWNGYYKGQILPATDYWFAVELIDNDGNSRNRHGHFSLIRR